MERNLPGMESTRKILIGSCGGLTGIYLAKKFKEYRGLEIWGSEISKDTAAKFFVDHLVELPRAGEERFLSELIKLLNQEEIDFYVPTHSEEMRAIAKNEQYLRKKVQTNFLVSPYETFLALDDKESANLALHEIGVPVPQLIKQDTVATLPIFMKQRCGSGSKGTLLIKNEQVYDVLRIHMPDCSFFEYKKGIEFTVDCMFDKDGELLAYNQRERVKTVGGAVTVTKNVDPIDIRPWLDRLSKHWKFCGCVNFQYILSKGTPFFIDVNLRYPSGGLPLSVASGMDVPYMLLCLLSGVEFSKDGFMSDHKARTMYRYFEELIEENDII